MDKELFLHNAKLFTPGPTPIPLSVKAAPLFSDIYHRSDEYYSLHQSCQKMLAPFFGTKQLPLILTCSGTGAMEAAVVHCTSVSDPVLVLKIGKFGERFEKIASKYGCDVSTLTASPGDTITPNQLSARLEELGQKVRAVFLQASETSTGALNPVKELTSMIRKCTPKAFIVVDAVSALCAHEIPMDEWGVDVMISGSQKGFGAPPGLAFIALSERALEFKSGRPRFYFDLNKEQSEQLQGRTAWTPAIFAMQSLAASLTELSRIGPANIAKHHERMATAVRSAMTELGLTLFVKENFSRALTSAIVPPHLDASRVLRIARERYGCVISGGQDDLKGKIFRFAHLGMTSVLDIIQGLAGFELALYESGFKHAQLGNGVAAAMRSLSGSIDSKA